MPQRDRDDAGRPRSTRPRDALGRPLPYGSRGVARIPDELDLTPVQLLAYAQRLLDQGLAFNAHEVLEAAWKSSPADERPLWQSLAQLAVGITHVQRGNVDGATAVLRRASAGLAALGETTPYSVDVSGLVGYASTLALDLVARMEITGERLHPALTTSA